MSREKALKKRREWLNNTNRYCIVDTETTGLTARDKVIEIAIIDFQGNVLLNSLVNPNREIHWAAKKVHGISDEMVQQAPDIREIAEEVRDILHSRVMIAYNSKFDARMIKQTFKIDVRHECLMQNVKDFHGVSKAISLELATSEFRKRSQEHRALGDCLLCLELIKASLSDEEEVS